MLIINFSRDSVGLAFETSFYTTRFPGLGSQVNAMTHDGAEIRSENLVSEVILATAALILCLSMEGQLVVEVSLVVAPRVRIFYAPDAHNLSVHMSTEVSTETLVAQFVVVSDQRFGECYNQWPSVVDPRWRHRSHVDRISQQRHG
ncbi:hypothetical protein TNCV_15851 [Trichonephila clavipes]|nr:hypothetical protein TNCV_15851 [Trichonephila clavipes]